LIVISGSEIIATEHEQREINVGDVHIKAGEHHWHGARANTTMGDITNTLVGSQVFRQICYGSLPMHMTPHAAGSTATISRDGPAFYVCVSPNVPFLRRSAEVMPY
jgi:hypothetical protein